jgi:hypothetical protein
MNEALDTRIIISGPVQGKLGEISRKMDYKILCSQTFNADGLKVVYFIPEFMEKRKEVMMLLQMLKAKKVSGIWNIEVSEEENARLKIISDFIRVPSVVLDTIFVFHGTFFVHLRFNKADIESVSGIILNTIALDEGYSVEYLGESAGTLNTMKTISVEIPLFLLTVISKPPAEELESFNNPMGENWKRVIKSVSQDDLIRAVYLTSGNISNHDFHLINEEMNLYEGSIRNPLLVYLNREFNDNGIVSFSRAQRLEGSNFKMDFIISKDQASQAMRTMGKMFALFPEWNCLISFASRLEDALETDLVLI